MSKLKVLIFLFLLGLGLYYWGIYKDKLIAVGETVGIKIPTQKSENKSQDSSLPTIFDLFKTPKEIPITSSLENYFPTCKNGQIVIHHAYSLCYNESFEQAAWVIHELDAKNTRGKAHREKQFLPDVLVKTRSSTPQDYSESGYDRGHLCPAGDFKGNQKLMSETFLMSNISPQHPEFNRGIWNDLETQFRGWSRKRGRLLVITGPILKKGLSVIGRLNKISVPNYYYKIAYDPAEEQAIGFLLKNEPSYELLRNFVVPIDEIEELTGIDFFEKLPDALEKKIEAENNEKFWYKK